MKKMAILLAGVVWLTTAPASEAQQRRGPTGLIPVMKTALSQKDNQVPELLPAPQPLDRNAVSPEANFQVSIPEIDDHASASSHCASCAAACPRKSCWRCFWDWLTYRPQRPPIHCLCCYPETYTPPLYVYFLDRAVGRCSHCP